ncbi:MAG: Propanediol utilization protein [Clostridia bacterium]|jgi:putative phosphotransacetylase|nr:Propanediol utilization protein [Clostridia bacterium]
MQGNLELEQIIKQVIVQHLKTAYNKTVKVGVSNRHVHLSREAVEVLFGKGYTLNICKELSQPNQYAAKECITLIGPKGVIEKVRILGPERTQTQVEILMSDTYKLGVSPVVRESGDLENTPGIHLLGPKGMLTLSEGVIVAKRHLHLYEEDAKKMALRDKSTIKICGGERKTIYEDVVVRVSREYATEIHLDMDEANAAGIKQNSLVSIISE